MGGWDDADMGTWNDTAQQANSSWNSATGWNREKRNSLKVYFPLTNRRIKEVGIRDLFPPVNSIHFS